jgi:plastocyanin
MSRILCTLSAALALTVAVAAAVANAQAVDDAVVQFGPLHPQPAAPLLHRLIPDEVSIHKGGTVLFVMNGGGHRVVIYEVSNHTTRADIEADLCQGGASVCNVAAGTQNLQYLITDGSGTLIVDTESNVQQPFINYLPGQLFSAGGPVVLTGTSAAGAAGHTVRYRFNKTGRYLVICATRGHSLNDAMFGFVDVVGANAS